MTTIQGNGYNPDTLILTPANAEALEVLVSGISGGVNDYVFSLAGLAPNNISGLNKRVSKTIPAAAVVDSQALGKPYTSPVTLARFEADAGTTNRGNVRMELNAVFGGERTGRTVRRHRGRSDIRRYRIASANGVDRRRARERRPGATRRTASSSTSSSGTPLTQTVSPPGAGVCGTSASR